MAAAAQAEDSTYLTVMDITPLIPKGSLILNRYGDGGFVINEASYKGNILIFGESVTSWTAESISKASPQSFTALFIAELPEIVLIGVGPKFVPLPPALKDFFRSKAIACDAMDTGAACRTFSVLLTEGRSVAAALIAI